MFFRRFPYKKYWQHSVLSRSVDKKVSRKLYWWEYAPTISDDDTLFPQEVLMIRCPCKNGWWDSVPTRSVDEKVSLEEWLIRRYSHGHKRRWLEGVPTISVNQTVSQQELLMSRCPCNNGWWEGTSTSSVNEKVQAVLIRICPRNKCQAVILSSRVLHNKHPFRTL